MIEMKRLKRKGFLKNYIIGLLIFSMIVTGLWIVPQSADGFFTAYNYNPTGDMLAFDVTSNVSRSIEDLTCDINPEDDSCGDVSSNLLSTATTFISGMVQGAFGGLISIWKSFGVTRVLMNSIADHLGIEPFIITTFVNIVLFLVVFTILLILFNRSDSA